MKTVTLRIDDNVKAALDEMLEATGMNIATFYNIYTMKALNERCIPFDITAPVDPFFSAQNISRIQKSRNQAKSGKVIVKSIEELEALEK